MIKDDVDFNDFAKLFRKGAVPYGNYWTILKSAWRRKDHPNLKILWFEEMKNDMMKVIRDVAYFIGHPITEYKVKVTLVTYSNQIYLVTHTVDTSFIFTKKSNVAKCLGLNVTK